MTKTEDAIAMLRQLIKRLEDGHEVMACGVSATIGEPLCMTLEGSTFSSVVDIRIEYKKL